MMARLKAWLGIDTKNFSSGIDGAKAKANGLGTAFKQVRNAVQAAIPLAIIYRGVSAIRDFVMTAREAGKVQLIGEETVSRLELVDNKLKSISEKLKVVGSKAAGRAAPGALFGLNIAEQVIDKVGVKEIVGSGGLFQAIIKEEFRAIIPAFLKSRKELRDGSIQATEERIRAEQALDHAAKVKEIADYRDRAATIKRIRKEQADDYKKREDEIADARKSTIDDIRQWQEADRSVRDQQEKDAEKKKDMARDDINRRINPPQIGLGDAVNRSIVRPSLVQKYGDDLGRFFRPDEKGSKSNPMFVHVLNPQPGRLK